MSEQKAPETKRRRNDIILIAALLLIAAVAAVYLFCFRARGDQVKVTIYGELYGVYSLNENRSEEIISGKNGENRNLLIIRDGKAYIESASCPDSICVSHHRIFRDGESIACRPHGVLVTVITGDSDAPDIVS